MAMLPEREYEALLALVRGRTGLVFPDTRRANLEDGVRQAMATAGVEELGRYLVALERGTLPLDDLIDRITVGETYFYREPAHFELVRDEVLPSLERRGRRSLRAWSAGCASGEEAYTLAMLLLERGYGEGSSVLATDISPAALERARRGCYRPWSLRGNAPHLVERHLTPKGGLLCVDEAVRRLVELRPLNLAGPGWPSLATGIGAFDLILCRNVLIYLAPEAIEAIARRFYEALTDEGWLLLGPSDPPLEGMAPFEVHVREGGLCYRRPGAHEAARRRPARPVTPPRGHKAAALRRVPVVPPRLRVPSPRRTPNAPASARSTPNAPAAPHHLPTSARGTPTAPAAVRPILAMPSAPPVVSSDEEVVRALANSAGARVAERTLRDVLRKQPMAPELHYLHALMLTSLGRPREAVEAVRRVLYLAPDSVVAHLMLALLRRQAGALPEARRALRVAESLLAALPPDQPVALGDGATGGQLAALIRQELHDLGELA